MSRSAYRNPEKSPLNGNAGIGIANAHNISNVAINPSSNPDDRINR